MPALTLRSILLLVIASLTMGLGYFWKEAILFSLLFFFICIFGVLVDYFLSSGSNNIEVKREVWKKLSLGDDNPVQLHLSNVRMQNVAGSLADNVPHIFQKRDTLFPFHLKGGETQTFSYTLNPHKRGAFSFENITLKINGVLGLVSKFYQIPLPETVKVYPSYLQLKKYQLQTRRANMALLGKKKQRKYGEGREFESLREYSRDDEYRKVNWKATARKGRPIVSTFQIERNQNIIILMDTGRMMRTKPDKMTKLDHAVNSALVLSFICINKEDNVGLILFDKKVNAFLAPARGKSQMNKINEILYKAEGHFEEPNYREAFHFLKKKVSKRSLIVLLTDIIDDRASEVLIREFTSLYPQHLPLCITLRDKSLEQKALMIPKTEKEMREMSVAQMLLEQRLKAILKMRLGGVLTLDSDAASLSVDAINKYVEVKTQSLI